MATSYLFVLLYINFVLYTFDIIPKMEAFKTFEPDLEKKKRIPTFDISGYKKNYNVL